MTDPLRCVIDASIAIKLFVSQSQSDLAINLFAKLEANPPAEFHIPEFFYVECANVLWQYVRRTNYPLLQAQQNISRLKLLALQPTPTSELVSEALETAATYGISAYDACYVELASRLNVPLITADQKLIRALASEPYAVYSLDTFSVPESDKQS